MNARHELRAWQRRAALGDLSAEMAQDFNNLMTAIRASCDLLLHDLDARDPRRDDVAAIARTSDQAAALARQLLALGRLRPAELRPIELPALVASLEPILLRLLGSRVHLVTAIDPATGSVLGDAGLLEHVLLTLVIRARDAMPAGGRLTISTSPSPLAEPLCHRHGVIAPGEYGTLSVRDEGAGLDDDALGRVFEPFPVSEHPGPIARLALSGVNAVVAQMRGAIIVGQSGREAVVYLERAT
jgi:signal transduction histidine kinase